MPRRRPWPGAMVAAASGECRCRRLFHPCCQPSCSWDQLHSRHEALSAPILTKRFLFTPQRAGEGGRGGGGAGVWPALARAAVGPAGAPPRLHGWARCACSPFHMTAHAKRPQHCVSAAANTPPQPCPPDPSLCPLAEAFRVRFVVGFAQAVLDALFGVGVDPGASPFLLGSGGVPLATSASGRRLSSAHRQPAEQALPVAAWAGRALLQALGGGEGPQPEAGQAQFSGSVVGCRDGDCRGFRVQASTGRLAGFRVRCSTPVSLHTFGCGRAARFRSCYCAGRQPWRVHSCPHPCC